MKAKNEDKDILSELKSLEKTLEKRDKLIATDLNELRIDIEKTRQEFKCFYRDINKIKKKLFILFCVIISASSGSGVLIEFVKKLFVE